MKKIIKESIDDQLMERNKKLIEKLFKNYINKEIQFRTPYKHYEFGFVLIKILVEKVDVIILNSRIEIFFKYKFIEGSIKPDNIYMLNSESDGDNNVIINSIMKFFNNKMKQYLSLELSDQIIFNFQ